MDIRIKGVERVKKKLSDIMDGVDDLRPVWKIFLGWYKREYVPSIYNSKGAALGERWAPYSKPYLKWKKKHGNKPMLRLTDRLYNASTGGAGWYERLKKKTFEFGISDSIKYAAAHQNGGSKMPQRQFLYKDDNLSPRAWLVLLTTTENFIDGIIKEND